MSRSQSVQSLVSNGSVITSNPRSTSISTLFGIPSSTLLAEPIDEEKLSPEDTRRLRIENQLLKAADHRQKAEICDLRAQIIRLNGQLTRCREIAVALKDVM